MLIFIFFKVYPGSRTSFVASVRIVNLMETGKFNYAMVCDENNILGSCVFFDNKTSLFDYLVYTKRIITDSTLHFWRETFPDLNMEQEGGAVEFRHGARRRRCGILACSY